MISPATAKPSTWIYLSSSPFSTVWKTHGQMDGKRDMRMLRRVVKKIGGMELMNSLNLKEWRKYCTSCEEKGSSIILDPATFLALLDRVERAEKDAERYRRLRDGPQGIIAPFTFWESGCNPEELDASLDTARAAQEGK